MHIRTIIISKIQDAISAANGAQPDTGIWNDLLTAVDATEAKLTAPLTPQSLKTRIHSKQHELQEYLENNAVYDLNVIEGFTAELTDLL